MGPRAGADAAARRADEIQQDGDVAGRVVKSRFELFHRGAEVAALSEENLKGVLQRPYPGLIEAGPAQPHGIQPAHGMLPVNDGERRDVPAGGAHAAHDGDLSDADELVDRAARREHGTVADLDVAAQHRIVRQDDTVAQPAVVGHVAVGHQEVVVADDRGGFGGGTPVNLNAFAKHVAVADSNVGLGAAVGQILGRVADDRSAMDLVAFAYLRPAHDHRMRQQTCSRPDLHRPVDDDIGVELGLGMDFGPWIHHGCRMYRHEWFSGAPSSSGSLTVGFVGGQRFVLTIIADDPVLVVCPGPEVHKTAAFRAEGPVWVAGPRCLGMANGALDQGRHHPPGCPRWPA